MVKTLSGKLNLAQLGWILIALLGLYLIVAWASYSPLDNGWSVANSFSEGVLNRAGELGAFCADLLYAMFGKLAWVVPFALFFGGIYGVAKKTQRPLTVRSLMGRMASFGLLLIGLSGLGDLLFSDTLNYLSGGFVGRAFNHFVESWLGLFGVILFTVACTVGGFLLSSGQSLITLLTQIYNWVMQKNSEPAEVDLQNNTTNTPLVDEETPDFQQETVELTDQDETETEEESEAEETEETLELPTITMAETPSHQFSAVQLPQTTTPHASDSPSLTDISQFITRPTIHGLDPEPPTSVPSGGFNVAQPLDLPQVNVATPAMASQAVISEPSFTPSDSNAIENGFNPELEITLPKVSLSPSIEPKPASVVATISPPAEPETDLASAFQQQEEERLAQLAERAKQQDKMKAYQTITQMSDEMPLRVPTISLNEAEELDDDVEEVNPPPQPTAYPKSYGETLIHPLLQGRHKKLEKPTTPLPTLDLLEVVKGETIKPTRQEIEETSVRIETELANFGVKAKVMDVLYGPVVTRYEIQPAPGVKAAKITGLDSDLARSLMFERVRIAEVIPGKPYIGIETPNAHRETVWLREVMDSEAFRQTSAKLPMALGKDISGQPVVVDMAKMPHLLVAGQTGSGKSVGVNSIILSMLFKLTPEQVRFIMIDPKVVELSIYNDIPHLLTPVVTDMKKATNALRWAVEEMERRYLLISHLAVRNIEGYNGKIDQATEMNLPIPNPIWRPGDTMDLIAPPLEKLPYIVLIVDEFADLIMTAGKQVEEYIMRIAQKARAVGIHLILATQRPSTDVITGVIKANIPSRIAFTVASQIDSRTILDRGGAESLLNYGDMLYSGASSPEIIRVHGAFMTDDDVGRVADNWRARGKPSYIDRIVEDREEESEANGSGGGSGELDDLFDKVVEFVQDTGTTSSSGIQRRFSIGFNRAARIVEQLEAQGILSSPDHRGKREILMR